MADKDDKKISQVWQFASESNPAKKYQTLQYTDCSTSCNCPGWTRRISAAGERTCKHTRAIDMGTADSECESTKNYNARELAVHRQEAPASVEPGAKRKRLIRL